MEQSNTNIYFKIISDKVDVKELQTLAMINLKKVFYEENIIDYYTEIEKFIGVRGIYTDKENVVISHVFSYYNFNIEIYLYYDQLEYYISKNNKILKKCLLEDFWTIEIHVSKFIVNLKSDLTLLNIPFNISLDDS
ncbi:hypothetical protein [Riemerella anatipestifer]|uniref:hypothetical protein n=1 Tax=Riemerella anatipestifer TaxID=34085 RepID=UPI001BDA3033|nr:hypothetical protein [Riemerella anatipestifer]MBT0552590.1 hypothetical protein [Riemerella anatipestifer]MBT0554893.1 hypothetical protein [Riemerella anatipestifer]MCU7543454.1 hypothetical protein [Riemerella anatipestifer]MCU7561062.1 hypothetical protein [Riemerella anatipestifer]MCW0514227.1 hypothetical protein [Riemerella anatipestifer]